MQTKSRCHHRYMLSEDAFFVTEDGIKLFISGESNQNHHVCGHVDFPLESREINESIQKEKRLSSQASQQLYLQMLELL
jgi:hypothetical protein